jgi:glycyl-radical enzyme activating protein
MTGIITDIQRFSLHDGPGIRTTIFFKGCNMRCIWCHNPETFTKKVQLRFIAAKCIGCNECYKACKTGALTSIDGNRKYNESDCTHCGDCEDACYPEAWISVGKEMSVQEVLDEVLQDVPYYNNSNGGVTISGGEPFSQPEFLIELVKALKAKGVHVGIETNLSYPWSTIEPIFNLVDLVMLDIKTLNDDSHKSLTGISNKQVLDNLRKLDATRKPYIVRTPLIPGANYSPQDIFDIAELLSSMSNMMYYELLNYNPLAQAKFTEMGKKYELSSAKPLTISEMKNLESTILARIPKFQIRCQIG